MITQRNINESSSLFKKISHSKVYDLKKDLPFLIMIMIMMMMMSQKTTFVTCSGRGPELRFR